MRLLEELKRRNVIRMAGLYLVGAWLVTQVAGTVLPIFGAPDWLARSVVILLAIGFVPALIFSWVYELTPQGLRRDADVPAGQSIGRETGRRIDRAIIVVLLVALGFFAVDRFVFEPRRMAAVRAEAGSESSSATGAPRLGARAATSDSAAAAVSPSSIAVLPFVDMSQAKDQEYFSDGLSEELLDLLAKIPQLKVIARTSSFSFKGKEVDVATIAKALNVANVLEGSVRKSGNTLRITAQLIRTVDSTHLWSDTYDRELTDVFKVQDEIAGAVVSALKVRLLPNQAATDNARRTSNVEVYNQFLLGKESLARNNVDDWRRATAAFRDALKLDPGYAPAWAGLSVAQNYLSDFELTPAAVAAEKRDALAAAEKAIDLAPDLVDGYEARSFLRYAASWDWAGVRADLDRIAVLDPNSIALHRRRASLLAAFGRLPEAIAEIRIAIEHDPLSAGALSTLGLYLIVAGDYATARATLAQALSLNPKSQFTNAYAGFNELLDGKVDAARAMFARGGESVWSLLGRSMIEHSLGNEEASKQALETMIGKYANGSAYQVAELYAWRGQADEAFKWLDRAYEQRDGGMPLVAYDPALRSLHGDPRFAALTKKMGLPQ